MSSSSCHLVLGRLLLAIGASSVVTGCGGQSTPDDTSAGGASPLPGTAGTGAGQSGSSAVTTNASCSFPKRFCLSEQGMLSMVHGGAEVADVFDANGCLRHNFVTSSCCNPALGPGEREGEQCCYQACDGVCCGRALVIGEHVLVAVPEQRADWLLADDIFIGAVHAARPALTLAERARLVELWQTDALMEHASIASFARFGLQLLALGAPARLVRDAQRAGLDEIRHAEHAFSIASRLAGRVIGPGTLPQLDAPLEIELYAVARAALVEGCIGETLAAVVALEQAHHAGDGAIRAVLLEVSEDETRHAELAFRFVAWALARGGRELREALRREVELRLRHMPEPSSSELTETVLHHYGRLTADEQRVLYRQVYDCVLRPTLAALLDELPAAPLKRSELRV